MKIVLTTGVLTLASLWLGFQSDAGQVATSPAANWNTYRSQFERTQVGLPALNVTACSSSACHGGLTPTPDQVITGVEYDQWHADGNGVHFRAFKVLADDVRSDRMAKLLYGDDARAQERAECRACHAFDVPESLRPRGSDLQDGVTCEACHGRAGSWLGKHIVPQWREKMTVQERTALGYFDTRDLVRRAEKCLECHLGTATKQVTHRMMAAGHPGLTFELAQDLLHVPKHWKDKQCYLTDDEGDWFAARTWAVGQAVYLRESMYRVAAWSAGSGRPDYALLDCYACHHDLKVPTWRQERTPTGTLGQPTWDVTAWAMCRPLVELLMPDDLPRFRRNIDVVLHGMSLQGPDRAAVAEAARSLATLADDLAQTASVTRMDRGNTARILRSLAAERVWLGRLDYRAAVQTSLALDALYRRPMAESNNRPANHEAILKALTTLNDHLYDDVNKNKEKRAGTYDPAVFDSVMAELDRVFAQE